MQESILDMTFLRGRETLATVMAQARFVRTSTTYINNRKDKEFENEYMWILEDPQCFPPRTKENFKKFMAITHGEN